MAISISVNDPVKATDPEQPYRILVVDDEPLLCRMISVMLKRMGYEVRTANSGIDALQFISEERPDLITLDVMMPDMSGVDVARRLRGDELTASIPIVFVTALDRSVSDELRALSEQPGIYHLDKPFSQHQLVTQVADALQIQYKSD
jgi:CheY-like chemotaxis protein